MEARDTAVVETLQEEEKGEIEAPERTERWWCLLPRRKHSDPGPHGLPAARASRRKGAMPSSSKTTDDVCPHMDVPVLYGPACPTDWIGYERNCYFFSEEERNWTFGQSFCSSLGSFLAVIESEPEKVFILRYKGKADHWIGLKKDSNQAWKWADGTEFNNTMGRRNCSGAALPASVPASKRRSKLLKLDSFRPSVGGSRRRRRLCFSEHRYCHCLPLPHTKKLDL
ncbi:collectin-12-like isoform X5 [Hemicordylus capensis]|uniref:collectin-12-like isoform X5 n=1 Tax=Hemicordylus capensis TaxID=884348 RepID=UPI002302BD01|nr:collectin-12-like isoform X5 [Hemicordylus capensis]